MDKPIIGIIGGIGSGKSFVAGLFAELGALVIDSDQMAHAAYQRDEVRQTLHKWWGDAVFQPDGSVDRKAIAGRVFTDPEQKRRLEALVHPLVHEQRRRLMEKTENDPKIAAFVWDTPLLVETGLHNLCDAVVFVDTPLQVRLERIKQRGWDAKELDRREKSQLGLDKKQNISDYTIRNAFDADSVRGQVREVFSRIIAKKSVRNG